MVRGIRIFIRFPRGLLSIVRLGEGMQGCGGVHTNHLMLATPFHRKNDLTYVELYLDEVLAIRCSPGSNHPTGAEHGANSWLLSNDYENPGSVYIYIYTGWLVRHTCHCIYIKYLAAFIHASTEMCVHFHRCTKTVCIPIKERKRVCFSMIKWWKHMSYWKARGD